MTASASLNVPAALLTGGDPVDCTKGRTGD